MDFTVAQNKTLKIYSISDVMRYCNRCAGEHGIFYKQFEDQVRMGMACPNSKPRIRYMRFEHGLDIPTLGEK